MTVGEAEGTRPDLVAVGEVLIQLTPPLSADLATTPTLMVTTAGAESNVASHLARLGHATAMVSAVGSDPWGTRIAADLQSAGVDVTRVRVDEGAPTGLYTKWRTAEGSRVLYHRSGSAASRMGRADADTALSAHPRVLHFSGVVPALSPSCAALARRLTEGPRRGTIVSFDVNFRPALWSPEAAAAELRRLARRSDIVFVGRDEAETLWGCRTDHDVRELLPEPAFVIVKDDDREAVEWDHHLRSALRPEPVEVREVVGAGDAFAAGWLSASLDDPSADPLARLDRAHRCAALVLASLSDHPTDPAALALLRTAAPAAPTPTELQR